MKRDPGLADLSREHLPALTLAYRLKHGRSSNPADPWPTEPGSQWQRARAFIETSLKRHFEAEEKLLIPLGLQLADPRPSQRVLAEHRAFWEQVAAIEQAEAATLPRRLQALGEGLEAHIRFEERVWFAQLQAGLSPEQLQTLGARIAAFEADDV